MASLWRETNTNAMNHDMKLNGELMLWRTTLNMIFSVTYYLDLHNAICFYQVKLLVFYYVQTTNFIFVAKYEIYNK